MVVTPSALAPPLSPPQAVRVSERAPMAATVVLGLLALALAAPVLSHAPADLATAPTTLALDWLLLFIHPLTYATSPELVWSLLSLSLLLLFALPFLPQPAQAPVAVVDPANCSGCQRCSGKMRSMP